MVSTADNAEFTLSATYKGVVYKVPGKLDEDGNPVYLNKEFSDLFKNKLSNNPNLVTFVTGNNTVEYFDSLEDVFDADGLKYLEQMPNSNDSDIKTRAAGVIAGRVQVWDDSNFGDRTLIFDIDYDVIFEYPHLKYYDNFNDKISSLRIYNYINPSANIYSHLGPKANPLQPHLGSSLRITFLGYEDDTYSGKVLLCVGSANGSTTVPSHEDNRLGNFGWNDKITAVRVLITTTKPGAQGTIQPFIGYYYGYPSITPYSPH